MSGFFKKLFNRIIGKTEEVPPPLVMEQLEAPAPVIVEIVLEPVAPESPVEIVPETARIEPKARPHLYRKSGTQGEPEPKRLKSKT